MIKADIAKQIAEKLKLQERDGVRIVDDICDAIREIVATKGRLEIRDFGVFQAKVRKSRIGRNPKKKQDVYPIPERRVVTFKMGKEVKFSVLNKAEAPNEAGSES
ncbi:MAG: HU family DNA-binding protein [Candidatus Sumerlaeaceae bacterium]